MAPDRYSPDETDSAVEKLLLKKNGSRTTMTDLKEILLAVSHDSRKRDGLILAKLDAHMTDKVHLDDDEFTKLIGLVGGGLAGLFILGAFSRRANGKGALLGTAVTIAILYYVQNFTHIHFFAYAAIGLISCFVFGNMFSLFFKPVSNEQLEGLTVFSLLKNNKA